MESGRAEAYLRLLAEAELRAVSPAGPGEPGRESLPNSQETARSESQLRVAAEAAVAAGRDLLPGEVTRLAGNALTAVGAIGHASAAAIADSLDGVLAEKGFFRNGPDPRRGAPLGPVFRPASASGPAPRRPVTDSPQVIPLAANLPIEVSGQQMLMNLLAYVDAAPGARMVGFARIPPPAGGSGLLHLHAVDDQQQRYRLTFQRLAVGDALWEGRLSPAPAPTMRPRWLTVEGGPHQGRVQVKLDLPASSADARPELVAARTPAELLVEAAAASVLAAALMPVFAGGDTFTNAKSEAEGIGAVLVTLRALGILSANDPALGRLLALCERLAIKVDSQELDLGQSALDLPDSWASVLADKDQRDGRSAVARVATALPEIDGVHIALTALESAPNRALLHMLTLGWDPPSFDVRAFTGAGDPPLFLWAQDDTGRLHTVSGGGWSRLGTRSWNGVLQFRPPIHPAATSLMLTVTGMSERLTVAVPLDWL